MKKFSVFAVVGLVALVLTACTPAQNQDRDGGAGSAPDSIYDTSLVEIYRNADNVPNVAYFCAGDFGWASTLSNDGTAAPALTRLPEYDFKCADQPDAVPVPAPTEAPR